MLPVEVTLILGALLVLAEEEEPVAEETEGDLTSEELEGEVGGDLILSGLLLLVELGRWDTVAALTDDRLFWLLGDKKEEEWGIFSSSSGISSTSEPSSFIILILILILLLLSLSSKPILF